jgi:hypothetical protein
MEVYTILWIYYVLQNRDTTWTHYNSIIFTKKKTNGNILNDAYTEAENPIF